VLSRRPVAGQAVDEFADGFYEHWQDAKKTERRRNHGKRGRLADSGIRGGWPRRDAVRAASKGNTLTADDDHFLFAAFSLGRSFRENNYHPFHAQVVMK
jgi:hypothetical protein